MKTTLAYQRDEHRMHLIWCPKQHKPVLVGEIAKRCQAFIEQKCQEKGWTILEWAIQPNHLHLFVRIWPSDSAALVVKECKAARLFN